MSKPKAVKPPPAPDPVATPVETPEVDDTALKKARRGMGYQRTMLTGSLTPSTGKSTMLG